MNTSTNIASTKVLVPSVEQFLNRLNREYVGFNEIRRLLDDAGYHTTAQSYPPYNIEQTDPEHWTVTLAVAGFSPNDIDILLEDRTLVITGRARQETEGSRVFLHRGIAERAFERKFVLSEGVEIQSAKLENGLLKIDFQKLIPEEKKPRRIEILT